MEKKCFIILPQSEPDRYPKGHFNRVYQYIIVPACRQAGFSAIRAGETSEDSLDLINSLIESDLILCDISTNNKPALYGFAVRQATGLPVVIMKDLKTSVVANIPEFDRVEYDESLRIDTVQTEIEILSEALKKVYDSRTEPNHIISRLNMAAPPVVEMPATPVYTEIPLSPTSGEEEDEEKEKVAPLPIISPLPDYVGEALTQTDIEKLKVGDSFFHLNYGKGEIITINHKTKDILAKIQFESGTKLLVLMPTHVFRKINE